MVRVFLGNPPSKISEWIYGHHQIPVNPDTVVKYIDGTISSFSIQGTISGDIEDEFSETTNTPTT